MCGVLLTPSSLLCGPRVSCRASRVRLVGSGVPLWGLGSSVSGPLLGIPPLPSVLCPGMLIACGNSGGSLVRGCGLTLGVTMLVLLASRILS